MARKANLFTTVTVNWTDYRGRDHEADIEVDYTFDGDDLHIINYNSPVDGYDGDLIDELVWEAVNERADEEYAEWLADYGDYLHEQRRDRAAESYLPGAF